MIASQKMGSGHLTEDQLRRYFLGEGDNEEGGIVEEHLLACDDCARMAVHLEAAVGLCRDALDGGTAKN